MGIIIDGSQKNISIHQSFWNALTENGSDSLALSQLWLCGINKDNLRNIISIITSNINQYENDSWGVNVGEVVLNDSKWDSVTPASSTGDVYLLSRGVSFLGDGINVSRVGVSQIGAHKGLISDGRTELSTVNITFLETNVSFADGVLRPWSVLVGHRSLKDQSLRCDIELYALEKWELTQPFKVRKSLVLKNAVPVSIDAEEYNYTGDKLIERQIQFAFDRYELRIYPTVSNETQNSGIQIEGDKKVDNIDNTSINANEKNDIENIENIEILEKSNIQDTLIIENNTKDSSPDDTSIIVEQNSNLRDFSIIYVDINSNLNKPSINGDINSDLLDRPSINGDMNGNIPDLVNITGDINSDLLDKPSINGDINSDLLDRPSINGDMNGNIPDLVNITGDMNGNIPDLVNITGDINLNLNISAEINTDLNINVNDTPTISPEINNYINNNNTKVNILANPDINDNLNIKSNISPEINNYINNNNTKVNILANPDINDNLNIKSNIKSDISNTSPEIKYIPRSDIIDAAKINWTQGRPNEDNPVILSNIKPNIGDIISVRL